MKDFFKYLYYKFSSGKKRWYPILGVYYLTYSCLFRCPYCSDGSGKPYYDIDFRESCGETALEILKKVRQYCDHIVITGGEPLEHSDFSLIFENISVLKFKEVVLTTNGYQMEDYLPLVAKSVNTLIFSVDSLDHKKADSWNGIGPGSLEKILDNIHSADNYKGKQYRICISSVVTPENIEDLYTVYEFSKQHNFEFAAAPQLIGVKAHQVLANNPSYAGFFNFLIEEKKKGGNIFGIPLYLEYMRDLKHFKCFPFTMLVVAPGGEVFYPCLEQGNHIENIMRVKSLHRLRKSGENKYGPQPFCETQCHSACALSFSLLMKNPFSYIFDQLKKM